MCCHNSAQRLPATLAHLARQEDPGVLWEVVLVDNASTDHTGEVARQLWAPLSCVQFRVVLESTLGLTSARLKGIEASRYEFIVFVDDDNWLDTGYLRTAHEVMASSERIGVCGGVSEGALEIEPPPWFPRVTSAYAIGDFGPVAHDPGDQGRWLCGAGLVLRRSAWQDLKDLGFVPALQDRTGTSLTSGGDTELCMALVATGWHQWYDPRLRLRHYMPKGRMDWDYVLKLCRGIGSSSVRLYPYSPIFRRGACSALRLWLRKRWAYQYLRTVVHVLARQPLRSLLSASWFPHGDAGTMWVAEHRGRLSGLWRDRARFSRLFVEYDAWVTRARDEPRGQGTGFVPSPGPEDPGAR
jgi:glycosyltransferase involved in cell wall biosynthesis